MTPRNEEEKDISEGELDRVIEEAKMGKSAGEDDVPYEMIKHLGPRARAFLLDMFRRIWRGEEIPQKWRTANIKTLLKEGKDPEMTDSYRPISLTSCLGKLMEKIVADRLTSYMEMNKLLNENQAGFRKNRCTTDQIHKLVQMAGDKMHENAKQPTTMVTFFDFSRAYDKVWREGLLAKMIKLKIPYSFIRYTRLFLSGRRTMVEINGVRSDEFYLNEGLP